MPTLNSVVMLPSCKTRYFCCPHELLHRRVRCSSHLIGGAEGHDSALVQHGHPVRDPEHAQYIMAYHHVSLFQP